MTDAPFTYTGLTACTLAQDANSSYLANYGHVATSTPMSGSTMGLLMLLSTFQYQAPYMSPTYSNAASQAGKAAFMETGGQAMQDKALKIVTDDGNSFAHSIGLTGTEMGIVGIGYKTYRSRQIDVRGPQISVFRSDLTLAQDSVILGLKWSFK
jgi:hypothetical protein